VSPVPKEGDSIYVLTVSVNVLSDDREHDLGTWSGLSLERLETALKLAAVVIGPDGRELNEADTWNIVRSTLIDAVKKKGGKKALDVNEVLNAADAKLAGFFRKPEANYTLISDLSVHSLPFKRIEVAGCQIESLVSRRGYSYPENIGAIDPRIVRHIEASRYKYVRVDTTGRSVHEAGDKAFRSLHLLRGLWSLVATYRSWTTTFGGLRRKPIGVIYSGPIHTLHHPDRTLVGQSYWFERAPSEDRELFQPSGSWGKIEKDRRWAMGRIRALPFRRDIEELIVRYIIALDQADHDVAFLQMWSILEKLTDTVGANYDKTLERTLWIFSERDLAKNLLECVRLRRNLYVHAARSPEEADQASYLIKWFIDPHLVSLIRNDFGVVSLEEYGQHLSLPTDLTTLRRNKKWAEKAIRILHQQTRTK